MSVLKSLLGLFLLIILSSVILSACSTNSIIEPVANVVTTQKDITISFTESKREDLKGAIRITFNVTAPKEVRKYRWSWGDGQESLTEIPQTTHDYQVSGNFLVKLAVTAGGANTAVFEKAILVTEAEINRVGGHKKPIAILNIQKFSDEQANEIIKTQGIEVLAEPITSLSMATAAKTQKQWFLFNSCKSYDPDGGEIAEYQLDFGNRQSTQGKTCGVLYFYTDPGEYAVTLEVTDKLGAIGSVKQTISWLVD